MIPFVDGRRALRSGITPRLGLAQQESPDMQFPVLPALGKRRQIVEFLLMRPIGIDPPANQAVVDTHAHAHAGVDLTDLLHRQHIADRIHPRTAISRINHHPHKTQVRQLFHLLPRKLLMLVPLDNSGQAFAARKIPRRLLDHFMFF